MNDMIERYIYQCTKRLDESKQKDVQDELRVNIYDMLGDDTSIEHTVEVLKKLGHPSVLALGYKEKKSYVISPRVYDDYIQVLKIVLITLFSVSIAFGIVSGIFNSTGIEIVGGILENISEGLSGSLFFGFTIVTIIFWIIDAKTQKEDCFDPKNLPKLPEESKPANKRVEGIFEVIMISIFGSLGIAFLVSNQMGINITVIEDNFMFFGNVLSKSFVSMILPVVIISLVSSLIYGIIKIVKGRYSFKAFIIFSLIEGLTLIAFTVIILSTQVLDPSFVQEISTVLSFSNAEIMNFGEKLLLGIIAIVWIVFIIEQAVAWYKIIQKKVKI